MPTYTPLTTVEQIRTAQAAGHTVQFTSCGDKGWITAHHPSAIDDAGLEELMHNNPDFKYRARLPDTDSPTFHTL